MAYEVRIVPPVTRAIKKMSEGVADAVLRRLDDLAKDPRPPGSIRIRGLPTKYRVYRVDLSTDESWYRIIYQVKDTETLILVLRVGDRKHVYERIRDLKQLLE